MDDGGLDTLTKTWLCETRGQSRQKDEVEIAGMPNEVGSAV